MSVPTQSLRGGDRIPALGKGTWDIGGETVRDAIATALDAGYTHVDTAEGYMNETEIGEALAGHDREELFLTSKVLPKNLDYQSVIDACETSLDRLGTDYLDLYLIHWPNPAISVRETMHAMADLHERGLVRNVGVSNFSRYQLSAALHVADVPIAVNQIEFHPYLQRPELVEYCQDNDVLVEAAAPLARTDVLDDPTVVDIADQYDRAPAQVVLRWAMDKGIVPLPKSTSAEHIQQNIEVFDWDLASEDRQRIDDLDRDEPIYDTRGRGWDDDVWGIAE